MSAPILVEPPAARVEELANGLTVCVLDTDRAPVVTCALFYRAGARDEVAGEGGTAHFLEHMMFKGSPSYPAGEIDRRTQALGGANNAFTSHDLTAYYFDFAPDRWREALAIETDRMAGLTLGEAELASERQVVLEEISLYEGEPWEALEQAVLARLYGPDHPYGLPVIGTRGQLASAGRQRLGAFHDRFYRPANAVLVLAGDLGGQGLAAAEQAFGGMAGGQPRGSAPLPTPAAEPRGGPHRIERRHGEVPRLSIALPAPPVEHPDHPKLRLLLGLLATGRSSRLERTLVDELELCSWVSADMMDTLDPGHLSLAAELIPGADRQRVEATIFEALAQLTRQGPGAEELERAQRILAADWVFAHQRIHDQALMAGASLALFDLEHPYRQMRRLLAATADELPAVAARWLALEGGVIGWSLPAGLA